MNQKKSIVLTTTFVGLVCGFILTQQQAAAAATTTPNSTTTSMVAPDSTAAATSAEPTEPTQKEQPVNQQTSTQKAVTNTDNVSEAGNLNQTPGTRTSESPTTATAEQTTTVNNNKTNSAQPQQETADQNAAANSDVVFRH